MKSTPIKLGLPLILSFILWWAFPLAPRAIAGDGDIEAGKKSVQARLCKICHVFEDDGGMVGPRLKQVGVRRRREWLVRWLQDPQAIVSKTIMPRVPWEEGELEDVVEYLMSLKEEVKKEEALALPGREAGAELVEMYDCRACHKIVKGGRVRFPDLTRVATRRDGKWLDAWLKDPQAVKPGTFMPTFPFSDEERKAIIEFLLTLK